LCAWLAILIHREVRPTARKLAPTGVCLVGPFVSPPHDAPGQTRPAPRSPRAQRGPLSRPNSTPRIAAAEPL